MKKEANALRKWENEREIEGYLIYNLYIKL